MVFTSIHPLEKFLATANAEAENVQVFRTDINMEAGKKVVIEALTEYPQVYDCTIDINDCDCVLRLVGTLDESIIFRTVQQYGFMIEELPG